MKRGFIVTILILTFFVASCSRCPDTKGNIVAFDNFDSLNPGLWSKASADGLCSIKDGSLHCSDSMAAAFAHKSIDPVANPINYTLFHGRIKVNKCSFVGKIIDTDPNNFTDIGEHESLAVQSHEDGVSIRIRDQSEGSYDIIKGWISDGTEQDVQVIIYPGLKKADVMINGSWAATQRFTTLPNFFSFGDPYGNRNVCNFSVDHFFRYNGITPVESKKC